MCNHYWSISTLEHGEHEVGICKYCGDKKDFTVLLAEDKGFNQICLANTLTRPDVSLERILADGNGKSRKPSGNPRGRPSKYNLSSASMRQ